MVSCRSIPSSGLAGSRGSSGSAVCHSGCRSSHPPAMCEDTVSTSSPALVAPCLVAVLTGVRWPLTVPVAGISLVISGVSVFSCAYCPSSWEEVCSDPLPVFNRSVCFLLSCVGSVAWLLTPYQLRDLRASPPVQWPFCPDAGVLCCAEAGSLMKSQVFVLRLVSERHCQD